MISYYIKKLSFLGLVLLSFAATHADAASLRLAPNTGVYTAGATFVVSVLVNTEGKAVNAADGKFSFNPHELQAISVSRASSIFNLWTEEPTFSNAAGTISFGGGSPTGYTGAAGTVMIATFRALAAGTPRINFYNGSILAADGLGTNVLTTMSGATFTIAAKTDSPAPEYIPPANTPQLPNVTSASHPDQEKWYKNTDAKLSWVLPKDVTSVRMTLDEKTGTVPTVVYDKPISEKELTDLSQGTSYFHLQFKNANGWGKIAQFKINVDSNAPKSIKITEDTSSSSKNIGTALLFEVEDISPILEYKIQIDGKNPIDFIDEKLTKKYTLPSLEPGYHTLSVEAFDSAGNSIVGTQSITIEAFEKPKFINYPSRINTEVIPAIKGTTRPHSTVSITIAQAGASDLAYAAYEPYVVTSSDTGEFTFIPDKPFEKGVYVITAVARDEFGHVSEKSDEIKIVVEVPGYIIFGVAIVNILSVIVPLVALLLLLSFGSWYIWHKLVVWKKRVRKETIEAEDRLTLEFAHIVKNLHAHVEALKLSRKGKLTIAENDLIDEIELNLKSAQEKISKEIEDIEEMVT